MSKVQSIVNEFRAALQLNIKTTPEYVFRKHFRAALMSSVFMVEEAEKITAALQVNLEGFEVTPEVDAWLKEMAFLYSEMFAKLDTALIQDNWHDSTQFVVESARNTTFRVEGTFPSYAFE